MLRMFVKTVLLAVALSGGVAVSHGQDYPTKSIRLIVPSSPGGKSDTTARLIAEKLSANLGVSIIVDNRPGAGGTLGAKSRLHGNRLRLNSSRIFWVPFLSNALSGFATPCSRWTRRQTLAHAAN